MLKLQKTTFSNKLIALHQVVLTQHNCFKIA